MSNADGFWDASSALRVRAPRKAADLMAMAQRQTRLADFGDQPVEDALDRLLVAYREEAQLSLFGVSRPSGTISGS